MDIGHPDGPKGAGHRDRGGVPTEKQTLSREGANRGRDRRRRGGDCCRRGRRRRRCHDRRAGWVHEIARIPVSGPAWFTVADNALWVTNQMASGLTRIDPVTNTIVAHVGQVPPCAAPVIAFDSIWQAACDADVVLRIDPARNAIVDTIPAQGHSFLVLAANRLITVGPEGLATLDPATGMFSTIGSRAAVGVDDIASDGSTVWVKNGNGMARLDPTDGRSIAGFSHPEAQGIAFANGHGWLTVPVNMACRDTTTDRARSSGRHSLPSATSRHSGAPRPPGPSGSADRRRLGTRRPR